MVAEITVYDEYDGVDPYDVHEIIEGKVLAIASKYAENGRIDIDRCVIETLSGEVKQLSREDCEELRKLIELDKKLEKYMKR